jgi:hypothetical protein
MTAGVMALAIFFYKNRKLFNQVTIEPSTKNVDIFMQTVSRKKRCNGKDKTEF